MIFLLHMPFIVVSGLLALFVGLFGIILFYAISICMYLFFAYILSKIGKKFNVGSFPQFLLPFYNVVLLCDCAKVERWVTAGIVLPLIASLLHVNFLGWLITVVTFAAHVYLWGNLAKRLGKNFWLWGIIMPLFGWLPAIVLAFDGSRSTDSDEEGQEVRYIEI